MKLKMLGIVCFLTLSATLYASPDDRRVDVPIQRSASVPIQKLCYTRDELLAFQYSPGANIPPLDLPDIPFVTKPRTNMHLDQTLDLRNSAPAVLTEAVTEAPQGPEDQD